MSQAKSRLYCYGRLGLVVLALSGCTESTDNLASKAAFSDVAWHVGDPTLMIGEVDSLPGHALYRVRAAFRRENGQILVADGGSNEVRIFNPAGRLLTAFGGTGGGPEEFEALLGMWSADGDSLVTWDARSQRIAIWSTAGRLRRTLRPDLDAPVTVLGRFRDGLLLGLRRADHTPERAGTTRLDSATALRLGSGGRSVAQLGRFPWQVTHAAAHPGLGGRTIYTPLPFDPRGVIAVGPDYFYFGWGESWEIHKYSAAGERVGTLTRDGGPAPVTQEMLDRRLEEWLAIVPPALHPETREFHASLPYPKTTPVFNAMLIDELEYLWVQHFVVPGEASARWSIFSPDGQWLGELTLPANLRPTHIGMGFMVAVVRSEDDVEQIGVFPLRRQPNDSDR